MKSPVRADTGLKRRVEWLWKPFIQRGTINLLTGGPGTGKSTISCDIAATLSRGDLLPGEDKSERGPLKTWILNAEDDFEDTLLWRLENQGADLSKIYINSLGEPIGPDDAKQMAAFIKDQQIALTVVDPVQAWIGAETDMYRPNHVRAWGNLFKEICQETGVTVLWVRHRRKGSEGEDTNINSGLGSIDFSGIVRSEIGAIVTKKGSKITRIKGNVGRMNDTIYYEIRDTGEEGNDHGQLHWSGEKKQETPESKGKKHNEIQAWLLNQLIDGPQDAQEMLDAGKRLGYGSRTTIYEAARELIVSEKVGRKAMWRLRTPADVNEQRPNDPERPAADAA